MSLEQPLKISKSKLWLKIILTRFIFSQKTIGRSGNRPFDINSKSYGRFPDIPIVFCEKRKRIRMRNLIMQVFRRSKSGEQYRVLSKLSPAVSESLFWSNDWWRHKYDWSTKKFGKETSNPKFYTQYARISFTSLCPSRGHLTKLPNSALKIYMRFLRLVLFQ